ncbi:hypothetical protein MF672_014210 [Actinomadura sp. ATCC 31491]|uniref:2'-5' RNA ligase family protein n=1 Tax=Actinomadura luzonensis TaxID=2805427 RepID=A0ABT0FRJ1_9ACTN|nr:hypothetical protein [Actinomadura luzonensis]MCK2214930.1 hypothetical protein [Actinomadura luzonensis]
MSDLSAFRARGRQALLSGRATYDPPLTEGARRWGAAGVLRPEGEVVARLSALAATLPAPGHWVHGGPSLHVTFRSLEPYREHVPEDDPLRRAYAGALAEAAAGLRPARLRLRGVSPHPGGVLVHGRPEDDTLDLLGKRFAGALASRGVRDLDHGRRRDLWYVSLAHFAGPVRDPAAVVAWCDAHADADLGTAELDSAEIVRFTLTGDRIAVHSLERIALAGGAAPV